MRSISLSTEAKEFISKLPLKRQKQIVGKIDALQNDQAQDIKTLVGFEPLERLRAGDYRIVFYQDQHVVNIVLIETRDRIYKKLGRKLK